MAASPTIYYVPVRGRAEHLRLTLASQHIKFQHKNVPFLEFKDLSRFKFGQARIVPLQLPDAHV